MVSSIIGEKIISLDPNPQEYVIEKKKTDGETLTVYRLDFSAKIKTPDGHKLVIIELQKASLPTDFMRFRGYLGRQYADEANTILLEDESKEPIPIYTIYFLGNDLKICDTPVLRVFPVTIDVATQQVVEAKSKFIELLTHKCWIVQISCLKQRRRNELEILLSVFDQANRTDDNHIMNVNENDFPKKYRPLIRRLKMAASDQEVKKQMKAEDEVDRYMQDLERKGHYKGRLEGRAEGEAERAQLQAEKDAVQAQLDAAQAEKLATQKNTVINCHSAGLPLETISSITGLSVEQITQILKNESY